MNIGENMDIDTYLQTARKELDAFHDFWLSGRSVDPEYFPATMENWDWKNLFEAWREVGKPATYWEWQVKKRTEGRPAPYWEWGMRSYDDCEGYNE